MRPWELEVARVNNVRAVGRCSFQVDEVGGSLFGTLVERFR